MRARPREINIFNMSLLDILCGALGAFCFMMLVALPYYHPGGPGAAAKNEQDILILIQQIDLLRGQMSDPEKAEELRKLIEKLKAEIQQLEGERNMLSHENAKLRSDNESAAKALAALNDKLDQAEAEVTELQQENAETKKELAAKRPFAVLAASFSEQAIDLYLERTQFIIMGAKWERFDPTETFHRSPLSEDLNGWSLENGTTVWVNANSAPGSAYRVFVKFLGLYPTVPSELTISLSFNGNFEPAAPTIAVAISRLRPYAFVGMVKVENDGRLTFKEATAAERDEDWRQRMKSEPPPAPVPAEKRPARPSASATPGPDASERTATREQIEEYIRRRRAGITPAPSPAASAAVSPQP